MTRHEHPRVALAVLDLFVPDSSSLAGDLLEEYHRRRSRAWLWRQVLAAVAITWFRGTDEIRPLQLVDLQPVDAQERSRRMSLRFRPVNLTASPLQGIGGLGLVALSILLTVVVPAVWWALLASIVAGVVFGVALIARNRRKVL